MEFVSCFKLVYFRGECNKPDLVIGPFLFKVEGFEGGGERRGLAGESI